MSEKTSEERSGDAKKEETGEDNVATEKSNGNVNEVSKNVTQKFTRICFSPEKVKLNWLPQTKGAKFSLLGRSKLFSFYYWIRLDEVQTF